MNLKNQKNPDSNELDFEKMNATLANPDFANWYYTQMYGKNEAQSIEDFVKVVKNYSSEEYE